MKKRIFRSMFLACLITLFLTIVFVVSVLYARSTAEIKNEVVAETLYISKAVEVLDDDQVAFGNYIIPVGKESKNRITLISNDGTVLYDNFASSENLDNHLSRPEVESAVQNGWGDSTRFSDTLNEKTYYYAMLLDNGNILRVACTTKSALGIMGDAIVWIILIFIFVLIAAAVIAQLLTKTIIKPINKLNLNDPLSNDTYEELSPLLLRMEKQGKEIEKQISLLCAQQKEFDEITGSMSEGLVIFGKNGSVLSANNSAKKILGSDTGHSYLQLCRNVDYIKTVESALRGVAVNTKMNADGRTYQLSANPVSDNAQSYAAILFIVDITEREQSEKIRREFSANVSHELKTPLTSIMGYAEIVENGIAKSEDVPRFAGMIRTEAARLLTLIEDIIKLSRLDEGGLLHEFEPVDLSALCRSIIGELSQKAKDVNVMLSFEGEKAIVLGVKSVLHEMIYNLCDNAITYNNKGGTMVVSLTKRDGKTVLSVSDTGIGIDPEHQSRVFERFYRVDKSHSKQTGGTGLGLSIVKHGALLHGAKLTLASKLGEGTIITIEFAQ